MDSKGQPDANDLKRTQYFRLHRKYDRTGTFILGIESGVNGSIGPLALTPEPSELDYLCTWLVNQKKNYGGRPKFIISPNVFVPNSVTTTKSDIHKEKSDSWPAFPETRKRLLNYIISNKIQNVVFLSGDVHCSNVAEIIFDGSQTARTLKAFSITSSAFYWPFWFADAEPSHFVHDAKRINDTFVISAAPKITMDYKAYNFTQKDNFCQIDVDWANRRIEVQTIDQKGKLIVSSTLKLA